MKQYRNNATGQQFRLHRSFTAYVILLDERNKAHYITECDLYHDYIAI